MAMEKMYTIRDTHTRSITAIGYNPGRREILIGCEDGVIKTYEAEGGKLVMVITEHKGWVTDFLYWILTGSFDKSVKIWSVDGKPVHKLDNFLSTVSGICYVPRNKTVWVAGGTSYASLFDPKSGDNVSDFIGTFQQQEEEKYQLQMLKYFGELNEVVASTSRRHLVVWKYNSSGCITALKCRSSLESLCYTKKVPILLFSGDNEGVIIKWERMQSNHFMYSKEMYQLSDSKLRKQRKAGSKARELMLEQQMSQSLPSRPATARPETRSSNRSVQSHYAFNKPSIPPVSTHNHANTTILKIIFVESLDFIIAASEDSNVYVWGFDDDAVKALQHMKPQDLQKLISKYSILLDSDSDLLPQNAKQGDGDSVTNRVAGFVCKHVFAGHNSCVTSLVVIGRDQGLNSTDVLSAGWDRRICLWDLEAGDLHDTFRNTGSTNLENMELACDGVIMDMDYSVKYNEFAYASSDKMVYIRKFNTNGAKMTLVNTLQGHEGEITCVRWNPHGKGSWVTGSEDSTIRIWAGHGLNECETVLSAQGGVCCLCIDMQNGALVVGAQKYIRVYDPESYRLAQTNEGHTDAIRSIIHIPERNQYVSCSWDKTIRVWNGWKMPKRKRQSKDGKNGKGNEPKTSTSAVKKVGFVDQEDTGGERGDMENSKMEGEDNPDSEVFTDTDGEYASPGEETE
ncbi:uncharacterized protein LOC110453096 [Mizuhopecten yessoensis]|uniref:Vegetative incompatibility protein HET-E-1 n=1 Tax=Mizuhopecten yessoensis TaxID=6573 RepID=A0A210QI52_MIZYE|nr:uncharacterized protein LOC110453096 [Mizuhopecten yessoensis]OWF48420.1 Vegetative incompatibility protein HET-E-1 [Mizuhopecten yessoensis]